MVVTPWRPEAPIQLEEEQINIYGGKGTPTFTDVDDP